jgi:hypothetical protein
MSQIELLENQKVQQREEINLLSIIDRAINDPNITVDKLNGLYDFHLRIQKEKAEKDFHASMVQAIGEIPSFEKKGKVDFTSKQGGRVKYDFAKFEHINAIVKPILAKYDLCTTFSHNFDTPKFVEVIAKITHKNGCFDTAKVLMPFDYSGNKQDTHALTSAISLGKRHSQNSLLNITTHGEDDDGFASLKKISEKQITFLQNLIVKAEIEDNNLKEFMHVEKLSDILLDDFTGATGFLNQIINTKIEAKKNGNK